MSRRWVRWMPAAAMPAIVAGFVLAAPLQGAVQPTLPAKSTAQLLDMVTASKVTALSGTVEQSVDLGLPQLPNAGLAPGSRSGSPEQTPPTDGAAGPENLNSATISPANIGALVEMLSSSHTARVYTDGPTKQRIQLLDKLAERDLIRNGNVVWSYDSAANTVTKLTLPDNATGGPATPGPATPTLPESPVQTPGDLATKLLGNIDPTTQVTVGENTRMAGRTAYVLELQPRTEGTLVGGISVAVDAESGLPLSVTVRSTQSGKPAFAVAFSHITLAAPSPSVFDFTPPEGATITEQSPPAQPSTPKKQDGTAPSAGPPALKATTSGTGWSTIVETPTGSVPASLATNPALSPLLHPVSGGVALETTLVNALVTPDGRLLTGSVPLAALQTAALQTAAIQTDALQSPALPGAAQQPAPAAK